MIPRCMVPRSEPLGREGGREGLSPFDGQGNRFVRLCMRLLFSNGSLVLVVVGLTAAQEPYIDLASPGVTWYGIGLDEANK